MCPTLKFFQHPARIGQIARLAQDFTVKEHQRIRAEHQRIGNFLGHRPRLVMRVQLAEFQW